ncbi:MAG TPA: pilus assembly protein TadG-related protein [Candidatus Dormibacteraeota bacterium]
MRATRRGQRGQAIVLIAVMLAVIVGMAALAIDGSRAYAMRRDLQAAIDSAALAATDKLQQTNNYPAAEQAASSIFGTNLRLYTAPSCGAGYGSPGAGSFTVTCTYSDGTALKQVVSALGPQGSLFVMTATRTLPLQFGRVLTNGVNPTLSVTATGNVNNLVYSPAVAALAQDGCGGAGGTAISVGGGGTLNVTGDVVSNGGISVSSGSLRVAGDIYASCQSSVSGATSACYSSGASTPCSYPDVAGTTRSGFRITDPGYPAPSGIGGGQGSPNQLVVLASGIYSGLATLNSGKCWFLSGGVYQFQAGLLNFGDFVSNELKPPDEPLAGTPNVKAIPQFWNTDGANCAGSFDVSKVSGPRDVPLGMWSFELTSTRTDTYNGVSYFRESAPSMCQQLNLSNHFDDVQLQVSNVPGATAYNVYASPPGGGGCLGPFGLATTLPVTGPVTNTNTAPCPLFTGNGCSLGNESTMLDAQIAAPFAPNAAAAPDSNGAYPPDSETAPVAAGLPNQNPATGPGARGDRANENNCDTVGGAFVSCPGPITPGAVEIYMPSGCLITGNGADMYIFSGFQYDWIQVNEPPGNSCFVALGAKSNSAYIGRVYAPAAAIDVTSPYILESPGTGGLMADNLSFSGTMPAITFSSSYAPVPPASRLTG